MTFSGSKLQDVIKYGFFNESIPWYFDDCFTPKIGDRFYLYCTDPKSEGLVGAGYIVVAPEKDEKSKPIEYYGWLGLEYLFDASKVLVLTLKDISLTLSSLPIDRSDAALLLDKSTAKQLDAVWADFIDNCPDDIFDKERDLARRFPKHYLNIWKKLHNID